MIEDVILNLVILVFDGIYIYIQKSLNFVFVCRLYSMYKYRFFVKFMMVVIMIGYIVLVFGFYLVDSKNNDVSILRYMIYYNVEEFRNWF